MRTDEGLDGRGPGRTPREGLRGAGFWLCAVAGAVILAAVAAVTGRRQFPGLDGGIAMNTAWALHLGQTPYSEVVTPFPPAFLLGSRWAFDLFGPGWQALVLVNALFTAVAFLVHLWLLRRLQLGALSALLIALAAQAMTTVPAGFWWYNQMTGALAALFVTAVLVLHRSPRSASAVVALALTTGFLLLAKPNVAIPLVGLSSVTLLWRSAARWTAMAGVGAGVVLAAAAAVLSGIDPRDMLERLADAGGRTTDTEAWLRFAFTNSPVESSLSLVLIVPLVAALAVVGTLVRLRPMADPEVPGAALAAVVAAAAVTAGVGIVTNNDYNAVDFAVLVSAAATTVALTCRQAHDDRGLARAALALAGLSALAYVVQGAEMARDRDRIAAAGPGVFYEEAPLAELPDLERLDGLLAGPRLIRTADEVQALISELRTSQPDVRVYFGPRLDWAYPVFDVIPAAGVPVYWEPYEKPSVRSDAMVEVFRAAEFDRAIFVRGDLLFLPPLLRAHLDADFQLEEVGTQLTVYRRRA